MASTISRDPPSAQGTPAAGDPTDAPAARQRRGSGRATLREVAALADVAPMTVSRVLRSPHLVSPPLRARIEAAVATLGYVPNRFARGLASQRTRIVPVVVPTLSSFVFLDILNGADAVLGPAGYQVLFSNTHDRPGEEERIVRGVLGWMPDGIIVAGVHHGRATRRLLADAGCPVVEAFELARRPIDVNVGFSHHAAGHAMARHFLARGYRRPAFFGSRLAVDLRAARRLAGFTAGLAEAGLEPAFVGDAVAPSSFSLGAVAAEALLARRPAVDAVFCASDTVAVGVILWCQRHGVPIPERLAVAGFNGFDIGDAVRPTLTTIRTPRCRIGELAARHLLDRIAGRAEPGVRVDTGFELLVRDSA